MLRDAAIAVSLANLCLIHVWAEILTPIDASSRFSMRLPPARSDFSALVVSEVLLAIVFWLLIVMGRVLVRRWKRGYAAVAAGLGAVPGTVLVF